MTVEGLSNPIDAELLQSIRLHTKTRKAEKQIMLA